MVSSSALEFHHQRVIANIAQEVVLCGVDVVFVSSKILLTVFEVGTAASR